VNSVKERAALTKKTTKTTKKKCRAIETTSEERKESDKKKTSIHRKTVKNVKGHQQDETVEKGGARTSQQRGAGVLAAWGAIGHSQRKRHLFFFVLAVQGNPLRDQIGVTNAIGV
jgi:hypothetical protein